MRAFVVKDGVDRELTWEVGKDPVITKTIEENQLFAFRSPYVRFVIDDADGRFLPGGEWEIQRGDIVYVMAGNPIPGSRLQPDSVEVFRGTVDRDILHDPEAGELQFRALGFLAQLKEIYLGIPFRWRGILKAEKYRYIKEITDDDIEGDDELNGETWEYRGWSSWYDQASRTEKTGYRKEYRFDSIGGLDNELFCSGRIYQQVEEGLWRRLSTEGGLENITFEEVISKIQEMLNFSGDWWRINFDPGEIPGEIDIIIKDKNYSLIHIFKTRYNDQDHIFFVGWNDGEGAEIYEIVNYTGVNEIARLSFNNNIDVVESYHNDKFQGSSINYDTMYHAFQAVKIEGNKAIFYEIWSWTGTYPEVVGRVKYCMGAMVEIYEVNLESGFTEYKTHSTEWILQELPITRKGIDIDFGEEEPSNYKVSPDFTVIRELEFEGGVYYADGQTMAYAGPRGLKDIQFDLRDAYVSDMLLEICKLTNSAMWVDYENGIKVIKIIGRDKVGTVRAVRDNVLLTGYRVGVSDYYGDRTPQIQSGILLNSHHLAALREYYETEFPSKEEVFTLRLDDDPESVAIGLGDSLMLMISAGRRLTPAKVSKVEIRAGAVKVEARRNYE